MKTPVTTDRKLLAFMRAKGSKTMSHGTHRAKRHPTSPRVK